MVQQPLELIHPDIYGPMPEKSLGGSRYFIKFCHGHTNCGLGWSIGDKATTDKATDLELEVTRLGVEYECIMAVFTLSL